MAVLEIPKLQPPADRHEDNTKPDLVVVEANGLIAPFDLTRCQGEDCHFNDLPDGCYETMHHLSFGRDRFVRGRPPDSDVRLFYQSVFNQVPARRCNQWEIHENVDSTPVPDEFTRLNFLREGALLDYLSLVTGRLVRVEKIEEDDFPDMSRRQIRRTYQLKEQYRQQQKRTIGQIALIGHIAPRFIQNGKLLPAHPTASKRLRLYRDLSESIAA